MDTEVQYDFTSEPEGRPVVEIVTGPPVVTSSWTAAAVCLLAGGVIFGGLLLLGNQLPQHDIVWIALALDGFLCWIVAPLLCRGRVVARQKLSEEEQARTPIGVVVGPLTVQTRLSPR